MAASKQRHPILFFLLITLTVFVLLGLSFRVVLIPQITQLVAANTVNSHLSVLSHEELVEVAEKGRAYVVGDPNAEMPVGEDTQLSFTSDVVSHMQDVRNVILGVFIATVIAALVLFIMLLYAGRKVGKRMVSSALLYGGVFAVAIALTFVVVGYFNFGALFEGMHKIFFADGTWQFAEDSLLLCAYPMPFWVAMGAVWGIVLILFSALTSFFGHLLRRKKTTAK